MRRTWKKNRGFYAKLQIAEYGPAPRYFLPANLDPYFAALE